MPRRISPSRARNPAAEARLSVPQALLLGALHGPTEVLPISSSGHASVLPWLLSWNRSELDGELEKVLEVVLHTGTAAAWLFVPASPIRDVVQVVRHDPRQALLLALASLPAGIAGLGLERPIERRLGTPGSIALGLGLGSLVMILADSAPQSRGLDEADPRDACWLGLAQASALFPGVSRSGATLSAARLRGFNRDASWRLSARLAGPVIAGATALKLGRLRRRDLPEGTAGALLAGGCASFGSGLLATRMLGSSSSAGPLWPFAAYRCALAMAIALRRSGRLRPERPPVVAK